MAAEDIRNIMYNAEQDVSAFFNETDFDSIQLSNEKQEMTAKMYEMITEIYQFLKSIKKA